jgi:hypothetical protein
MPSEVTMDNHQSARPIPWFSPQATMMSSFPHWATDSLRDKLQTLSIFIFILDQMDKPSGICIMSPNTKAIAFNSAWFWPLLISLYFWVWGLFRSLSIIIIYFWIFRLLRPLFYFWVFGAIEALILFLGFRAY